MAAVIGVRGGVGASTIATSLAWLLGEKAHRSTALLDLDVHFGTGALSLDQVVSSGGDWPRNFGLDPTGRWLIVANQKSDSIVVFRRDAESGKLATTSQRIAVPNPVCLRFRAHTG